MGKFNGIPCQIQVCNEFSYLHLLDEGWYYTPEEVAEAEIKEKRKALEDKEAPEADFGDATEAEPTETEPALTDDDIRTMAKEAGISHWHTKSIDRLVSELKEPEDAERSEN